MATIKLINVSKSYRQRQAGGTKQAAGLANQAGLVDRQMALDDVNLTIPNGRTCAVVGPSGCGKSTLLRVVAGLESEHSGNVFYDDRDMQDIPPKERYIGMVFQNYALYPHFRGRGNLEFFFKIHRTPDEETAERIRITSQIMGIGFNQLLRRKPGTLSGGEQQRIALGRAIVRNPSLFLLDEPLSNLDAKLRARTRVEIKRLLKQFRITSVYVTHDQLEAITLGDKIVVMRAGRIEQEGPYQLLRRRPANTFVAGFLGNPPMNLFEGGVVEESNLTIGQISIPLPETIKDQVMAGQKLTLGVRPEEAQVIGANQLRSDGFHLRGLVEVVEPDFARQTQLAYVRTDSHRYSATGNLDKLLHPGQEVDTFFALDHFYFFNAENGKYIG